MLTVEDQIIKLSEVAEIAKLTSLVKEKAIHFFKKRLETLYGHFAESRGEK